MNGHTSFISAHMGRVSDIDFSYSSDHELVSCSQDQSIKVSIVSDALGNFSLRSIYIYISFRSFLPTCFYFSFSNFLVFFLLWVVVEHWKSSETDCIDPPSVSCVSNSIFGLNLSSFPFSWVVYIYILLYFLRLFIYWLSWLPYWCIVHKTYKLCNACCLFVLLLIFSWKVEEKGKKEKQKSSF